MSPKTFYFQMLPIIWFVHFVVVSKEPNALRMRPDRRQFLASMHISLKQQSHQLAWFSDLNPHICPILNIRGVNCELNCELLFSILHCKKFLHQCNYFLVLGMTAALVNVASAFAPFYIE
jgi:hypothetical protein